MSHNSSIHRVDRWLLAGIFLLSSLSGSLSAAGIPNLTVDESDYGSQHQGSNSVSVEGLRIRISAFNNTPQKYTVQSIFLRRGAPGTIPTVDDVAVFEVTDPNDTFEVMAKPISLVFQAATPADGKPAAKGKPAPKGKPAATPIPSWQSNPREGYVVIALSEGKPLAQVYSSDMVKQFCKEHPEILKQTGTSAARQLDVKKLKK